MHRHQEAEAHKDEALPWAEEMGQLDVLTGHYHQLLSRQKERTAIENYVVPHLLRGNFNWNYEDQGGDEPEPLPDAQAEEGL